MKLFLTGIPGIGKTTVVKKVYSMAPDRFAGFWTQEIREKDRRLGFEIVTTEGHRAPLAHVEFDSPHRVGRYGVDVRGFEEVVMPLLENALHRRDKIILVDEIGKMELLSRRFAEWVKEMLNSDVSVLATIPIKDVHPLVSKIRREYPVIEVTLKNRNDLPREIARRFHIETG